MTSKNASAKKKLIKLYGAECFIDKLGLRKDTTPRVYRDRSEEKKMKKLTYHHIREKREGGKATIENGALLSTENHQWFNQQPPEEQRRMNKKFQEYKQCKVVEAEDIDVDFVVLPMEIKFERQKGYNRSKAKREFQRKVEEEYEI